MPSRSASPTPRWRSPSRRTTRCGRASATSTRCASPSRTGSPPSSCTRWCARSPWCRPRSRSAGSTRCSRSCPPAPRGRATGGAFCEQPPLGLLEVLEEAGCYVVEDDFLLGWRWFTQDVATGGDPFDQLAAAYVDHAVPSSTRHESREHRSAGLIEKVRRARADAVVFAPAKFCEPALFDYVLMKQGLEREGIPHLLVEFEEKMWTFERTRNEVETFVESMLFE
jgi:hypothetical protein